MPHKIWTSYHKNLATPPVERTDCSRSSRQNSIGLTNCCNGLQRTSSIRRSPLSTATDPIEAHGGLKTKVDQRWTSEKDRCDEVHFLDALCQNVTPTAALTHHCSLWANAQGGPKTTACTFLTAHMFKTPKSICTSSVNPLTGTLKPQSNGPLYSNTVIGTLAVDGWAVTFGTAMRGLGGAPARPGPSSLYQM